MVYFDNAATSYPKPNAVIREMARCMELDGGNPGRSGHRLAQGAQNRIYACRELCAEVFGSSRPENVIFTTNATHAIHTAVHALYRPGRILISDIEHNAVYRTVMAMRGQNCAVDFFRTENDPTATMRNFRAALRGDTVMCVVCHKSNLCGMETPISQIGAECRRRGICLIADVSQSAGHQKLSIREIGADALCMPGHKGLYGPQGTGILLLSDDYTAEKAAALHPVVYGGSGSFSKQIGMPDELPDRLEAGTLNTPSIAGLTQGIRYVMQVGYDAISERERQITRTVTEGLANDKKTVLYGDLSKYGSPILCNRIGVPCEETARLLDRSGVCVRAGLHCCPLGHKKLGTDEIGAVRVSPGWFQTAEDAKSFLRVFTSIR